MRPKQTSNLRNRTLWVLRCLFYWQWKWIVDGLAWWLFHPTRRFIICLIENRYIDGHFAEFRIGAKHVGRSLQHCFSYIQSGRSVCDGIGRARLNVDNADDLLLYFRRSGLRNLVIWCIIISKITSTVQLNRCSKHTITDDNKWLCMTWHWKPTWFDQIIIYIQTPRPLAYEQSKLELWGCRNRKLLFIS